VDLATLLLDADAQGPGTQSAEPFEPRPEPLDLELVADAARRMYPLEALKGLAQSRLQDVVANVTSSPWAGALSLGSKWVSPGDRLFFNRPIGPHRRVHSLRVPLQSLKEVRL